MDDEQPECGKDFCDDCGDCLYCYGIDPCYDGGSHNESTFQEKLKLRREKKMIRVFIITASKNMYREVALRELAKEGIGCSIAESVTFPWANVNPDYMNWSIPQYEHAIRDSKEMRDSHVRDMQLMSGCDAVLLISPCGRNSHLMAGFAVAMGKPTYSWLTLPQYPDTAYCMLNYVGNSFPEIIRQLRILNENKENQHG